MQTQVHIADSLGYANKLMVIGPYGNFDGSNITFSQDPASTANSDGSPCVEINAQVSGRPHFNCSDCVFRNCSSYGTGGGVQASPYARLTLVRPRFVDCLAGYIGWSHTHKPVSRTTVMLALSLPPLLLLRLAPADQEHGCAGQGFGDGCYCSNADPSLCTGCTCQQGTAGGQQGFYCDSERSNSTGTCDTVLQGLCGGAKGSSKGDCFICCGSHQQALQAAGCDSQDFARFCG